MAALVVAAFAATPVIGYDWLQFNGDSAHSGNNTAETILGAGNVASSRRDTKSHCPARGTSQHRDVCWR